MKVALRTSGGISASPGHSRAPSLGAAQGRLGSPGGNAALSLALVLALVHGLLYVFLVPPWQHYDEPGHFEYALWIAGKGTVPKADEYDPELRRQMAASMLAHGFYRGMAYQPDLLSESERIWIGPDQLGRSPLYYVLASVPLRLLSGADVTTRLYAARLLSLALYLVSIAIAYAVVSELTPAGHPLRAAVPITMALLPGYTDLMTAVNNDVLAVVFLSSFLWGSLRLIRRGFSAWWLLWVASSAFLGVWAKNSALVAVPLLPIPLLFALLRGPRRRLAWALLVAASLGGGVAVFGWGDAALWYRRTAQGEPTRAARPGAPLGDYVFQIHLVPATPAPVVVQAVPPGDVATISGRRVTLGAWVWATRPIRGRTPILFHRVGSQDQAAYRDVDVDQVPAFVAVTATVPEGASRVWVGLAPVGQVGDESATVFYDGVVLAEGERPLAEAPRFEDAEGRRGTWGGSPFVNLLRNASAEDAWPWTRPWAEALVGRSGVGAPIEPSVTLASLLDWQPLQEYHRARAVRLFRTFWAEFGWGHVPLPGWWYRGLGVATLLGIVGSALALWRGRRTVPWDAALLLGFALAAAWLGTWARGSGEMPYTPSYMPVARYAYPAIIPATLVLAAGWWQLLRKAGARAGLAVQLLALLTLDEVSLLTIIQYYYGR